MAVFERDGSTDGPVISSVVAIVQLARTEWISRVNQCPDHFMPQRKHLKALKAPCCYQYLCWVEQGPLPKFTSIQNLEM